MKRKKEIQEELKGLSPFLSKMKEKEEAMDVPTGYFDQLPEAIFRRLNLEEPVAEPQISWLDQLIGQIRWLFQARPALALASIAILIAIGITFLRTDQPINTEQLLADMSTEEINTYIADNIDEFDMDLLIEVQNNDPNWEIDPFSDLEEEELNEYLEEIIDDIDLEDIENLF